MLTAFDPALTAAYTHHASTGVLDLVLRTATRAVVYLLAYRLLGHASLTIIVLVLVVVAVALFIRRRSARRRRAGHRTS